MPGFHSPTVKLVSPQANWVVMLEQVLMGSMLSAMV